MLSLMDYLKANLGKPVKDLTVLSANKDVTGIVVEVEWNTFPKSDDICIECSWVTIHWENDAKSYHSIDFMDKVEVVEVINVI